MAIKNIERVFLVSFGVGFLAAIVAFIWVLRASDSTTLGNAGDLVSGVTGVFGVLVGSFAIVMYVRAEDARTKVAARTWEAKLRLEEAIHGFDSLLKIELRNLDHIHGSASFHNVLQSTRVKDLYFVGPALERLDQALEAGLVSGLYRALSLPVAQLDTYSISAELLVFAAHVKRDLRDERVGIGTSYFVSMPRIYRGLLNVTERQITAGLAHALPHGPELQQTESEVV